MNNDILKYFENLEKNKCHGIFKNITQFSDGVILCNINNENDHDKIPIIVTVLELLKNYILNNNNNSHISIYFLINKIILRNPSDVILTLDEFNENLELYCKRIFLTQYAIDKSISLC